MTGDRQDPTPATVVRTPPAHERARERRAAGSAVRPTTSAPLPEDIGYRGPTVCQPPASPTGSSTTGRAPGWSSRASAAAHGSGTQRLYSFRDILVLKIVKRLLDTGVSLQQIRTAVQHLRDRGIDDLAADHPDERRC